MSRSKSMYHESVKDVAEEEKYQIFDDISILVKGRFKWSNLPLGIESRHIEEFLYEHGQVAFYEDEKMGFKCLPCNGVGRLNPYGDELQYIITSINGETKTLNSEDMVRIIANDHHKPTKIKAMYYAEKLSKIEGTMEINLIQQRTPYIIPTTKDNELTMKNIFKKIRDGVLSIFVDDRLTAGGDLGVHVLKTEAPYLIADLQDHKNNVLNEMFSWLGINNTNTDKKERLLVDEVNVNNSFIQLNLENEFKNRQLACELINKKYNQNISVEKTIDTLQVSFVGTEQEAIYNE